MMPPRSDATRTISAKTIASHRRVWAALLVVAVFSIGVVALPFASSRARARAADQSSAIRALVALVGTPDLALSSSARWLRHPSQAEPGAAMADGPASLDTDPAGGLIGPPREVVAAGARPLPSPEDER